MKENQYQAGLIRRIKERIPGCLVLKNDANYIQGIFDLTVLLGPRAAHLEVKASEDSPEQPNQRYYINAVKSRGGFAEVVYPENEEEVLLALQRSLGC